MTDEEAPRLPRCGRRADGRRAGHRVGLGFAGTHFRIVDAAGLSSESLLEGERTGPACDVRQRAGSAPSSAVPTLPCWASIARFRRSRRLGYPDPRPSACKRTSAQRSISRSSTCCRPPRRSGVDPVAASRQPVRQPDARHRRLHALPRLRRRVSGGGLGRQSRSRRSCVSSRRTASSAVFARARVPSRRSSSSHACCCRMA